MDERQQIVVKRHLSEGIETPGRFRPGHSPARRCSPGPTAAGLLTSSPGRAPVRRTPPPTPTASETPRGDQTAGGQPQNSYTYDGLGRRIAKAVKRADGQYDRTDFILNGGWQVVEERTGTVASPTTEATTVTAEYAWDIRYIDAPICVWKQGQKYFYACNAQYSVAALTDAGGNVVERYGYDAYGKQLVMDAAGQLKSTRTQAYGFTGREFDGESGLWYFRARMYSEGLGRFVSRDPAGYVDGYSLYNGYFVPNSNDPEGEAQSVQIQTVEGPTPGYCGAYSWKVKFVLSEPSKKGGWIIQEISFRQTSYTWGLRENPGCTRSNHFWEAWYVYKGKTLETIVDTGHLPFSDEYLMSECGVCTGGTTEVIGWVSFYEDTGLPAGFMRNNPKTAAGFAYSTDVSPYSSLPAGTAPVSHSLYSRWHCMTPYSDFRQPTEIVFKTPFFSF